MRPRLGYSFRTTSHAEIARTTANCPLSCELLWLAPPAPFVLPSQLPGGRLRPAKFSPTVVRSERSGDRSVFLRLDYYRRRAIRERQLTEDAERPVRGRCATKTCRTTGSAFVGQRFNRHGQTIALQAGPRGWAERWVPRPVAFGSNSRECKRATTLIVASLRAKSRGTSRNFALADASKGLAASRQKDLAGVVERQRRPGCGWSGILWLSRARSAPGRSDPHLRYYRRS